MKFLHIFVLPDVVSASIADVELIAIVLSVMHLSAELTETLKIVLSYKSYFAFLWDIMNILNALIYIHIY